ncbi:MAG: SGNH/GDSL hydrolase family protein, partial [Cyanothece sp. SIO1E1]|nr:SGNH/GDSL hydrolase family protein [Cyanothece sp. SIO1E1]
MLFQKRYRRSRFDRRRARRFGGLPILLLLISIPVGLELLALLIVKVANLSQQLTLDRSPAIVKAYQLKFVNPSGQPYQTLSKSGELVAVHNLLMGYHLAPTQQSEFWTINEQGFRDQDPVPPAKPNGEVRIFVLGGSTAFGQLSSSNPTTFTEKLETRLNEQVKQQQANADRFQPAVLPFRADQVGNALALPPRIREQQYRVINAAVPGYASGNELALLVQHVADYNPDILVVLNSYADLMLPSDQIGVGIPGLDGILQNQRESLSSRITNSIQRWFGQLSAVRLFQYYGLQLRPPEERLVKPLNLMAEDGEAALIDHLAIEEAELNLRVQRYRQHLLQMVRWTSGARKRLIIGLQPEISGRSADVLTPEEAEILKQLGGPYIEAVQTGYGRLAEAANQAAQTSENAKVLNLYR